MARKSSDSITHVKNVVKTRNLNLGSTPKRCQNQNCSDIDVSSVVKNGTQCNLNPPVVHPVALSSNGNNNVRDEQISGMEEAHADVKQGTVLGLGLNPNMAQYSDHNDPSGHGLSTPKQYTKHNVNQQVASESDMEYQDCVNRQTNVCQYMMSIMRVWKRSLSIVLCILISLVIILTLLTPNPTFFNYGVNSLILTLVLYH